MSEESLLYDDSRPGGESAPAPETAPAKGAENAPSPADGKWHEGLPEDLRGLAEVKGWKSPEDALKSYRHLEELMGADKAGRGLVLPKDDNDKEAFDKIYDRLGRPEKADDYALADFLKSSSGDDLEDGEGYDENMLNAMSGMFHEAGLSKKQGQALALGYNKFYQGVVEEQRAKHLAEVEEVKKAMPPEQLETVRRGFRFLGLEERDAVAIEAYLGVKKASDLFAKIGGALAEDKMPSGAKYVGGDGSTAGVHRLLLEKKNDSFFMERYLSGDKAAKAEMDALYAKAYPEDK